MVARSFAYFLIGFFLLFATAALSKLTQAFASGLVTHGMLLDSCQSVRYSKQGYCQGYVIGVGDVLTRELGFRQDIEPVCMHDKVDWETAAPLVVDRTKSIQNRRENFVRPDVEVSWGLVFPCLPSPEGSQPRRSELLDGLDLRSWCQSKSGRRRGRCEGYLVAVFERLSVVDVGDVGCLPAGQTGSALAGRLAKRLAQITDDDTLYAWLSDGGIDLVMRGIEAVWGRTAESCKLIVENGG